MASENLPPHVITRVMREIRDLVRAPADGIQYDEGEDNTISEIYAIISGPGKKYVLNI